MKSPFPGMDPYLEEGWRDVRQSFTTYAADELQSQLPPRLVARIDCFEFEQGPEDDSIRESFILIKDSDAKRIVTIVQFIPITYRKPGAPLTIYLKTREMHEQNGTSFVEIDLLRGGVPVPSVWQEHVSKTNSAYSICIRRGWKPDQEQIYAIQLPEKLPIISIPLRQTDEPARLDVQSLLDRAYKNGAYYRAIDYSREPVPPFKTDDSAWANKLLRAAGKR